MLVVALSVACLKDFFFVFTTEGTPGAERGDVYKLLDRTM